MFMMALIADYSFWSFHQRFVSDGLTSVFAEVTVALCALLGSISNLSAELVTQAGLAFQLESN